MANAKAIQEYAADWTSKTSRTHSDNAASAAAISVLRDEINNLKASQALSNLQQKADHTEVQNLIITQYNSSYKFFRLS